jgi:conjugal transfer/entry exclusion protein
MNGPTRNTIRFLAAVAVAAATCPAHASLVFDIPNLIVNKLSLKELRTIRDELHNQTSGTVNYNTLEINKTTQLNYDIDADFTWIINNGGDEIIPIPRNVMEKLNDILGAQSVEAFNAHYRKASDYSGMPQDGYDVAVEGSRARKAANDTLVQALSEEQNAFVSEIDAIKRIGELNKNVQGQGNQLQVANALAVTQVNQMMKLRSMMLVSESVRAAEAQVSADKDARAIAISRHMRDGLEDAAEQSVAPRPVY